MAGPVRQSVRRLNVTIALRPVARRPSARLPYAAKSVAEHWKHLAAKEVDVIEVRRIGEGDPLEFEVLVRPAFEDGWRRQLSDTH